jgi:hypothetical protein
MQFDLEKPNGTTENHTSSDDPLFALPRLCKSPRKENLLLRPEMLRTYIPYASYYTQIPIRPSPHPQSPEEDALLIRQLYGHVPTEEIVPIVDGLRAERERNPFEVLHRRRVGNRDSTCTVNLKRTSPHSRRMK